MADAFVGATVHFLLEKAISVATDRMGLLFGFKEDLETLRGSAAMIQAVLADAENKQRDNQAVQLWLRRLEGVAFDAIHVLDELNYEILRRKVESRNQLKGKVCFFFSFSKTIGFRSKVKKINIELKKINQEANDFGLIRFQMGVPLPANTGFRQTDSIVAKNVVGRINDESKIVEMLLSPSEEVVSVIPIIGMGGLGKTTLAKSVYNHRQIEQTFGKRIWVCVSEKFEVIEVFKLMLESLTRKKVEMDSRDAVVQEIREKLERKRYLLVFDDVWNEKQDLWDDFFSTLVGLSATKGSWCLLTTRLENMALTVSAQCPYLLGKLSDDDCWSITREKVIGGGEVPKELSDIRDKILKRCDGLPLAASVIGGLLRINGKEEWLSLVEKSLLNGDQHGVEQILKVSFDHLSPASVKQCFAYCSIFPKDDQIKRDVLIELWMAEGFLQPYLKNDAAMEEIGDKYLRILLQSSLLEEVKEVWRIYYKMHDLVHDFAESVVKPESSNRVCYLALESSKGMTEEIMKNISPSISTLFLDPQSGIPGNMLSKFMNLHVLNLSIENLEKLPNTIGKLIHLRFLNLSKSRIATLPESLCKLYNLQTLRINDEYDHQILKSLPKKMSNLISLRHLHYWNSDAKFQMPLEMGRLKCLQTLKFFNIGLEKGRRIEELQCLGDLSGSLEIRNLELVNGKEGAEGANLFGKPNLSELSFQWGWDREYDSYDDENVLEGLQPHPNLKKLRIKNYMGDHFPQWFMNLSTILSNLVDLSLTDCKRCKEIPALGQLPFLKKLSLRDMGNLVEWMEADMTSRTDDNEEAVVDVFPMLEILTIENCSQLITAPCHFPNLKELSIKNNNHVLVASKIISKVTTLESLAIYGMAGLTCLHNNQSLKYLRLNECPNLTSIRGCCSTSLQNLNIKNCENLKELSEDLCKFQSLHWLEIQRCPSIVQFPEGEYNLTSLESLEIRGCNGWTSLPDHMLESCTSLWRLTISGCNGLTSLPGHMLESCITSLNYLTVYDCPNLVSFPLDFQKTPSLSYLRLYRCPKLMISDMPKGFGFLTRLRSLNIGPLWSDDSSIEFDWSGLISLSTVHNLTLYGMPQLESLPDQLQHLTTLTSLEIDEFGGVEALPDWIGNLANLEELGLWDCAKLRYLPSVAAVRRLTKLNTLYVRVCPLLKERCSPQSGPDSEWSKISHIPRLRIR